MLSLIRSFCSCLQCALSYWWLLVTQDCFSLLSVSNSLEKIPILGNPNASSHLLAIGGVFMLAMSDHFESSVNCVIITEIILMLLISVYTCSY